MIFSLVVGASLFVEIVKHPVVLKLGNSPAMYRAALINHSLGISAFTFARRSLLNGRGTVAASQNSEK